MKPTYKDVESCILTTLVVENKQSIFNAVNRINNLYSDSYKQESVKFAEWVDDNYYRLENNNWSDYKTVQEEYTTEQLYEIYKNKQP